jgi:saccharopine dehydrogenase-like NADP-dependent oxidoreductase
LLIYSYFTTIPGGRAGAGGNKIKANSAQLNLAGAWAELGNIKEYKRLLKTIKEYQLKEVHSFVILNMFHKCKYCDYQSPYRPNLRRHEKKHIFYETFYWFFSFTVHLFVSKT